MHPVLRAGNHTVLTTVSWHRIWPSPGARTRYRDIFVKLTSAVLSVRRVREELELVLTSGQSLCFSRESVRGQVVVSSLAASACKSIGSG